MKGSHQFLVGLSIAMFIGSSITLTKLVRDSYALYVAESKCVAGYISQGVERRDITTGRGTCRVKQ